MSSFTSARFEPTGKSRNGRAVWRVVDGFRFDIGYLGSGLSVEVPAGFETDLASIPGWAMPFMAPGSMVKSAAVHDRLRADTRFGLIESDAIFLTAMAAEGVTPWRREVAFLAVRSNHNRG